ncbi:MAG: DNA repair protein RecO [bacterium]|nr:DNA repair protein RecO [bacterium]
MSIRSLTTEAIVLKRSTTGEADRIITLLTKERGKIACVAKGIRKMTSSKGASLETGNYIKCHLILTKSLPILTQASLLEDCHATRESLSKIRQLSQLLEIFDQLFVEDDDTADLFSDALKLRSQVTQTATSSKAVRLGLENLMIKLGYQDPKETAYQTILEYVSALSEKPMRSWEYLKV